MNNKKLGNALENKVCTLLGNAGCWVHKLTQSEVGQPADIIAVKNGKAYLIDCKVCQEDIFTFARIEPNQITAMQYWKLHGNGDGLFFIEFPSGLYVVPLDLLLNFRNFHDRESITPKMLDEQETDYRYNTWRSKLDV